MNAEKITEEYIAKTQGIYNACLHTAYMCCLESDWMKFFDVFSKRKNKNVLLRFELINMDTGPTDLHEQLPIKIYDYRLISGSAIPTSCA